MSDRFYGPIGLTDGFEYQVDPDQARRELEQARLARRGAPTEPSYRDRVVGCLLAGAVGDALGAGVDHTELTLFTLEGLIRAHLAGRVEGAVTGPDVPAEVHRAYLRWLHSQQEPVSADVLTGWLVGELAAHTRRAPDDVCLTALRATNDPRRPPGGAAHRINDSSGAGAVMRGAAVALWPARFPAETFGLAAEIGALTHGHPNGYLAAAALAVIVRQLLHADDLRTAVSQALSELRSTPDGDEVAEAITAGWTLARDGRPTAATIADRLGHGSTGDQSLAIAICAAFSATNLEDGVLIAVNHPGDTGSTGAIAGALLGALYGVTAIPTDWPHRLESRDVIERLAADALAEFGDTPPELTDTWLARYPPS